MAASMAWPSIAREVSICGLKGEVSGIRKDIALVGLPPYCAAIRGSGLERTREEMLHGTAARQRERGTNWPAAVFEKRTAAKARQRGRLREGLIGFISV